MRKVDIRLILNIQGYLLLILSACMLLPIYVAIIYNSRDLLSLIYSFLITLITGFLLSRFKSNSSIMPKEGFIAVAVGWIFCAFFGALPYYFDGSFGSFVDCFFESMSGFTTTGASILKDIESIPKGLLFWRSETHWLGGMGIILLTIAILPVLGINIGFMYNAEVPGPTKDRISPKLKDTAKILWFIYTLITIVEVILLKLAGMDLYNAVCHTFGTVATGGFSTMNSSIAQYNNIYIEIIIMIFMYIAGTNFTLYYYIYKKRSFTIFKDPEWKLYTFLIIISIILISIDLYSKSIKTNFLDSLRVSSFQVLSIITTTGYVSDNFELWSNFSKLLLFFLMFVGGCSGSTGGSIKPVRFIILFKLAVIELRKLVYPKAVFVAKYGDEPLSGNIMRNCFAFFIIFLLIFVGSSLFLTFSGYDIITGVSATIACLGNVGPGFARVGAIENYSFFDPLSKLLLSFLMLLGRLELFSVIILFYNILRLGR